MNAAEHQQDPESPTITEKTESSITIRGVGGFFRAWAKWDGCIEYFRYTNGANLDDPHSNPNDIDQVHICDIDREITRLQAIKIECQKHFGADWPDI